MIPAVLVEMEQQASEVSDAGRHQVRGVDEQVVERAGREEAAKGREETVPVSGAAITTRSATGLCEPSGAGIMSQEQPGRGNFGPEHCTDYDDKVVGGISASACAPLDSQARCFDNGALEVRGGGSGSGQSRVGQACTGAMYAIIHHFTRKARSY